MTTNNKISTSTDSVVDKLKALYKLQKIDNEIFKIETLQGELPLEVSSLEDDIAGLKTRIEKFKTDINSYEAEISAKRNLSINAQALIKKYEEQQINVRNNREFESISKEIEYQNLEIELNEKYVKEFLYKVKQVQDNLDKTLAAIEEKHGDLEHKHLELDKIIADTKAEKEQLLKLQKQTEQEIEERLLNVYARIKRGARNKLAIVVFSRDSCGGCFNAIPPQRMVDIRQHKKIIDCEYCGRILIDPDTADEVEL